MGLGGISIWQLLIVLIIVFALFGTKKLRGLGGDLGAAIRGFKEGLNDDKPDALKQEEASQTTIEASPQEKTETQTKETKE